MSRIADWAAHVNAAEITAEPVKRTRTRDYGSTTYSFWEHSFTINGVPMPDGAIDTLATFKTLKAATAGTDEVIAELRALYAAAWLDPLDAPEAPDIKAFGIPDGY